MTTQLSPAHSLQGWGFACLRALLLPLFALAVGSALGQCVAPAPYTTADPCYVQAINDDPFCCDTTWDTLCQSTYDACAGSGGGTDCLNITSFGSAAAPIDGTVTTISTCNFQTEYATVTGIAAGQTYLAGSTCGGYITVRSGTFNGPVVAAGNAPLSFTATVSGTYYFHYNTNAACGTATACCTTTIACTSCSTGGGGGGGGPVGGSCEPGVGGAPFAGAGPIVVTPIGGSTGAPPASGQCNVGGCVLGIGWGAPQSTTSGTFVLAVGGTWGGEYNTYNVTAGQSYEWSTCVTDGAISPTADTQLTLYTTAGVPLCYSDDFCGLQSKIAWTATFTGQVFVQVNQFNCASNTNSHTVAWRCVSCAASPPPNQQVISTPQELITDVFLGECLTASNVTFTGATSAVGTFSNGWAIGIENGIVLTSGNATLASGANGLGSAGVDNFQPGNALLTATAGMQTFDASVFTFTFVPETDQVTFTYVFASEEYPEFVCSAFNDVFGFYVSGPGYAANTNIAIIPGSTLPVAIDNVNNGIGCPINYPAYYVDNSGGTSVQYDGFTVPLTACVNTVPCEAYTITIAIADAGDGIYDSAVFLAAESFSAGTELEIVASVDQDLANVSSGTNCDMSGFFVFALEEPASEPVTLVYTVDVQGEASVDPIPLTVTFQPGETLIAIPVTSVAAGTSLTTVELTMSSADNPGLGCSCTQTELSSTLYICDQLLLLPVTWLAFEAKNINDQREVLCEWITASEQNNDYFTVERSVDGQVWIELGTVAGSGNTSEPTNYQFVDRSPAPGVSYYRIRQTDYNGQFDYSEIRAVERNSSVPLEAFPNPGNGMFKLSGYHDGDLAVYDLSGRRVPFTLSMRGELRLVNPAAGSYILELVRDNGEAERLRIVVH